MKWIRHMTSTWDDEKIAAVIGKGGDSGLALYGAFWRIAEIIASQMEGSTPSCAVSYPVWKWTRLLFVRKSYLLSILVRLQKEDLIEVEGDLNGEQSITVRMPNLLKYRDEYSRKSGHSQDKVPPILDIDKEEEKEEEINTIAPSENRSELPRAKVLGTLPLNDGTQFEITDRMIAEWSELYPAVDVTQQCKSMKGWCLGNPTKLKTRKGIVRFITSWLDKEQNRGPRPALFDAAKPKSALEGMVFDNDPKGRLQ